MIDLTIVNPIVEAMNVFVMIYASLPVAVSSLIEFAILLFFIRTFVHIFFSMG